MTLTMKYFREKGIIVREIHLLDLEDTLSIRGFILNLEN